MRYKAFISYSHAADGKLAPALQSALHRFAKPWHRLRAIHVFRDKTSLAVTPALWPSIENALSDSEYFILMASPESAESHWVKREVCWWIEHRAREQLLIVLTEGELAWDESTFDFDWNCTTAVGHYLAGKLESEPLYVDLRWARNADGLSLRHSLFREAVLDLAAPLNGRLKDELDGEDVRQHRRTMRVTWFAAAAMIVLTIAALIATGIARHKTHIAEEQRQIAIARQLAANANLAFIQQGQHISRSILLAVESLQRYPTAEGLQALSRGLALLPRRGNRISIPVSGKIRKSILSPGGYYLATVDMDYTLRICEVVSGREIIKLDHKEELVNLCFSTDGRWLAVILGPDWREGKTLIVLEAATGREAIRLTPEGECEPMAWDQTGKRLAIACYELQSNMTTVRVVDVASKREVAGPLHFRPQPGHFGSLISSMAFSPDGKWLATGGFGLSQVWELANGHEVTHMRHVFPLKSVNSQQKFQIPESIETMVFSPDGRFLATISWQGDDRPITIWEAATGRLVARVAHPGGCHILAFSPDNRLLATSTGGKFAGYSPADESTGETSFLEKDIGERTVKVWDPATGTEVYHLNHDNAVKAVAFSPDGKWIATSSWDNTARLWESGSGREVARLAEPTGVIATTFRDQSTELVTISMDYHAQVWEAPQRQEVRLEHLGPVRAVAFSPDGKWLGTGSGDRTARLWETTTGREVARLDHPEEVTHLAYSPDGHFLATGMHGMWHEEEKPTTVRLWEVPSGREIALLAHPRIFTCLVFSPDGSRLATGCGDGIIRMWETATGREMFRLDAQKKEKEYEDSVRSLAFSPDGRRLAAGYTHEGIRFWDLATQQQLQLQLMEKKPSTCLSLSFSSDGKWLAAGNSISSTVVMETASGKKVADLPHVGYVETLIFHPTQPWLAMGNKDYFARLWELPRGREMTLVRHSGPVSRVVFSPDGRFVASSEVCPGPYQGGMSTCRALARVWEAATGVEVAQFPHEKGIDDVAFSPDGRLLASASRDGTARLWHWQPEDLIQQACSRLTRNLLQTEWRRYMDDLPYHPTCPDLPVTEE